MFSGTRNTQIIVPDQASNTILCLDCAFLVKLGKTEIQYKNYVVAKEAEMGSADEHIGLQIEISSRIPQELISELSLFSVFVNAPM